MCQVNAVCGRKVVDFALLCEAALFFSESSLSCGWTQCLQLGGVQHSPLFITSEEFRGNCTSTTDTLFSPLAASSPPPADFYSVTVMTYAGTTTKDLVSMDYSVTTFNNSVSAINESIINDSVISMNDLVTTLSYSVSAMKYSVYTMNYSTSIINYSVSTMNCPESTINYLVSTFSP